MKNTIYRHLLIAGITLLSFVGIDTANAAVDYTGSFVNMEELSIGQSGTISGGNGFGNAVISQITGYLPSNSMITFSYNFSGTLRGGLLASGGSYSYDDGIDSYEGFTVAMSAGSVSFSGGTVNGAPSDALAFSSAQITGTNAATTVIENFSGDFLGIMSLFIGAATGSKAYIISYGVSEVPLPAALPMFGMGLVVIAGLRARKKRKV